MEDKSKKSTYLELLTSKELVDKLCDEISRFFADDKICGTLTVPSSYPKEVQNRIEFIALIASYLKDKFYKEVKDNTVI